MQTVSAVSLIGTDVWKQSWLEKGRSSVYQYPVPASQGPGQSICNSGGKFRGKIPFKPKSVKRRNKVGETHLLLTSSRPLLLSPVSPNWLPERGPGGPGGPPNLSGPEMLSADPCSYHWYGDGLLLSTPWKRYWYGDALRPGKRFWKYCNFTHTIQTPAQVDLFRKSIAGDTKCLLNKWVKEQRRQGNKRKNNSIW